MLGFIYFIDVSETSPAIGRISSHTRDYTIMPKWQLYRFVVTNFCPKLFHIEAQQQLKQHPAIVSMYRSPLFADSSSLLE